MRVLVTGGLGAIGSFATRHLIELGEKPVVYDLRRDLRLVKDIADQMEIVEGDILDWPKLLTTAKKYQIERIIHTAALMPPVCKANPPAAVNINVQGVVNILEVARAIAAKRVVFASTMGVYAPTPNPSPNSTYEVINEDYAKNPSSLYDATRFFCERLGQQYLENYGLDFIALRFGHTYGPGKLTHGPMASISRIIDNAIQGKETVIPNGGEGKSDFVYNRDTGRALVLACLANNVKHHQFHISTGTLHTYAEYVEAVRQAVPGAKIKIGPGIDFLGVGHFRCFVYDLSRAREELGYTPKYDLTHGIADYVKLVQKLDYFGSPS